MVQTDITASGTVVWQGGDGLDEADLATVAAKSNQTDYVERGLSVTYDGVNDTIDIGSGHAVIEDSQRAYDVLPAQETGISLPAPSGVNYVYLVHDPETDDDVRYHVDDDDSAPSDPSLKIAEVDAGASTVTEQNRDPTLSAAALAGLSVNDVVDLEGSGLDVNSNGVLEATGSASDTRVETQDAGTTLYTDTDVLNLDSSTDLTVTDDGNGQVTVGATGGGTDTRTDVSDNGVTVVQDAEDIDFGTDLDVTDDGDGSVTVDSTASGGSGLSTTTIDDTDSPFTTSDEDVIYVDTSAGAVTVTLASSDATLGNEIEIHNISGANAVTVQTESTETIDPNAQSSVAIGKAGWSVSFVSDGSNWDSSLEGEFDSISTETLLIGGNNAVMSVAASGNKTLTNGRAEVGTALSATDATFYLALGIDDPNQDAKITGRLFWDDSDGTYNVEIIEDGTNVGNPTVNYDILRVR